MLFYIISTEEMMIVIRAVDMLIKRNFLIYFDLRNGRKKAKPSSVSGYQPMIFKKVFLLFCPQRLSIGEELSTMGLLTFSEDKEKGVSSLLNRLFIVSVRVSTAFLRPPSVLRFFSILLMLERTVV